MPISRWLDTTLSEKKSQRTLSSVFLVHFFLTFAGFSGSFVFRLQFLKRSFAAASSKFLGFLGGQVCAFYFPMTSTLIVSAFYLSLDESRNLGQTQGKDFLILDEAARSVNLNKPILYTRLCQAFHYSDKKTD